MPRISLFGWKQLLADDISALPRNESIIVIGLAFILALSVAMYLKTKKRSQKKDKIELNGEIGGLKFIYTGTGQIAVFFAVFLVIITVYIALRLTPVT